MAVLRRTRILSLLTALLLLMTIICSSCNRIGFTFPKYSYINSVVKGFKNSDDKVNLDGELNDEVWSRMRWLEVSMKSDENVKVRMTSYFGSDGLYFAFDVDDTAVYSVRGRGTTNNSGIELYISSLKGSSSIEGYGYEIDLSANGELVVRKYLRGKYRAWPSNIHFAVKTDGELNTPACKGYTIEAYLPYSMFDGNETKAVYAMPAIIRSLSANSDERRQWYCFGMEDRDASWTKASTWWTFNEEGLLAHDVTFDVGEHGKIEGHSNVVDGDDYTFKIIPDSGYYAKSVKVDGKNVEADLLYKSGVAFYRVENVTANLKITAEFSAIPAEEINVNGKITADSKAESGISAYLVYRGYAKKVELKSDGSYSSSAPAVKGLQLYAEASGYITDYKSVPTSGGTVNLNLKKMYLGSNSTVKAMRQYNESQWDLTRLYESRVRSLSMGKFITIMNTEIFSDTVFASANISLPLLKNVDTRAGFIFYTQDGQDAFVALTMNNEKGQDYYSVQVISKNSSNWSWQGIIKDISKDTAIREKANSEDGVNLSVLYNKGKFDIWINGTKIASNVTPVDKDKNLIPSGSKVAVGLQTWNYKAAFDNLILRGSGIQDSDRGLIGGYIMSKEVTGSGKIDGPSLAAAGDLYKFYVVPSKGWYASSVTVNGVEVVDKLLYENEKAYYCIRGVTGDTKIKAVFKNVPAATVKISGTIKENNKAISGVKAWFVKGGYMQSISLSKDGDFSTQVPDINGFIYATANGYVSKYVPVSQAKNGVLNIDMQKNYIGTNSNVNHKTFYADKWDLSRLGQGIVECLSTDKFTTAMNTNIFATNIYVSANITLPRVEGYDTRAGFIFYDSKGNDVFIALTMNNEKGQYYYSVQLISKDGSKWRWKNGAQDISTDQEIVKAANSEEGVPFAVLYYNGKFDIWVNNWRVATGAYPTDENDNNLFSEDAKVAVGLQSWNNCTVFSNLNFDNKRPQEADWDLSQLSNGTVKCLNPAHRVILDLDNTYKSSRYVEANIQLPRVEKQDTRAGFRFTNKSGQDAFVALTMTNEKGEYTYTLQIIHRAGNSWAGKFNRKFDIFNLTADEVKEAASSKDGIPFAVWYHDGLFDVWVNNTLVMADSYPSDGDVNIFSDDNKVTFGLESWRYKTQFTGLKYGETDKRPQSADWKKISDTEYQSKSLSNYAELILDSTRRNKVFVTANVQLPMVSYDDSRGGFVFYKEDGTGVFLGLQTNKSTQKYSVLAITLKPDGSTDWVTNGSFIYISDDEDIYKAANSSQGVPIGVLYDKGKFDLWINGKLVGYNINARGDSAFTENSKVTVSLESWRNYTSYHKVAISDSVSSYKLNGTVKLYQNGTYVPLANTEITFVGAHDGYTFKLTTDSQGRFASPNPVPMDMYTLSYGDSSYTGTILHSSDNAKECVIQFNYAYVVEGSADLSRMNDDNHTIIVNESSMVRLNTGSAFASQRYYVLSLKIRALSPITYDWNKNTGVAFASVGAGKGNTYMMSFLIGTSEDENLIKIQNNDKGHGSFNGENIPQDQWYKNVIMTQQLFGDGINCKYVRANKYVYLLAELDGKWQQIGRMLIGDRDNDILFLNWYTKTEYSHITLTEGISAVADALSGYSITFPNSYTSFNYPISATKWGVEAKIQDLNPTDNAEHRIFTVYATDGDKGAYSLSFLKDANQSLFRVQKMSGNWASANLKEEYSNAIKGDGLYVRFIRDGVKLMVYVSLDGINYEKVFERDDLPQGELFIRLNSWQTSKAENIIFKVGSDVDDWK